MKKILLSVALLAATCGASAQKLSYIPYEDNALMMGITISANGRYVAGGDTEGRAFIYDTQAKQIKYFESPNLGNEDASLDDQASIRSVTNDGVGYGDIYGKSTKFDFATCTMTALVDESIDSSSLVHYATSDGKVNCGVTYDNTTFVQAPYVMVDGVMQSLPELSDEWAGYEVNGAIAYGGNADGSVLWGAVCDNFSSYPLLLWVRNRDGKTYSANLLSKRFVDTTFELSGAQPYDIFTGAAMSANGKWLAVNYHTKMAGRGQEDEGDRVARFDLEADTLQLLSCPDASAVKCYYATGISNEGTVVGFVEDKETYARKATMCPAGTKEMKLLADLYPTVTEFATMDEKNLNEVTAITPDGRYLQGFGYVDLNDEQDCFGTWYFDLEKGETAVENVKTEEAPAKVVASYTVDGKTLNADSVRKGIVINKLSNGKARKVVK